MAQSNSVFAFIWKTSNDSRGRTNLRVDMNQVTNLKSLEFFTNFWSPYFGYLYQFIRRRWFTCTHSVKLSDDCWFSSINPFVLFAKYLNEFTISYGAFSLFMIPFTRGMLRPPAVFTGLRNWLLSRFVLRVYLEF